MKALFVIALFLLVGCIDDNKDTIKEFIPGTYVRPFDDQYYKGWDTIYIKALGRRNYVIQNYGSYFIKKSGKIKSEKEEWAAVYKSEDRLLRELKYGKTLSFEPKSKLLYVGCVVYQKVP